MVSLVWLQRELRVEHLPALQAALACSEKVIVAYFHDKEHTIGQANQAWLMASLQALQKQYANRGGDIWLVEGAFSVELNKLIQLYQIEKVFYSFQVGQVFTQMQNQAFEVCQQQQIELIPMFSECWFEPEQVLNQQSKPYKVFTPFYKAILSKLSLLQPLDNTLADLSKTNQIAVPSQYLLDNSGLKNLAETAWAQKIMAHWQTGEDQAWQMVDQFISEDISDYQEDRDFPSLDATSHLSMALHFGEINSRALYFYLLSQIEAGTLSSEQANPWLRQLVWREFAHYLLYWFPQTESKPFQLRYEAIDWSDKQRVLQKWQKGQTGIPIVDAGMQELWQTGYMHNRVRMLVASLLTKNLNQHWLRGVEWFADCLVDADPANNVMGWQWVAGCGVDASPYYRLFNPVTQSKKFDKQGVYIKRWLPQLKALPDKMIHEPWKYQDSCSRLGVQLGTDYPLPIVDLDETRLQHLDRVERMKTSA